MNDWAVAAVAAAACYACLILLLGAAGFMAGVRRDRRKART